MTLQENHVSEPEVQAVVESFSLLKTTVNDLRVENQSLSAKVHDLHLEIDHLKIDIARALGEKDYYLSRFAAVQNSLNNIRDLIDMENRRIAEAPTLAAPSVESRVTTAIEEPASPPPDHQQSDPEALKRLEEEIRSLHHEAR